jgi:glycosyltransferase involved in cell wall biosynthesis
MSLAYLMNTHPMTSTTFVKQEVRAHEAATGETVSRFAIRPWAEDLVEATDIEERDSTEYLLAAGAPALIGNFAAELVTNPLGMGRAIGSTAGLVSAGGNLVKNVAYLAEAVRFKRRAQVAGVEHVHVHFSTNPAAVAMLSRRLGGPAYSFTVHGPDELVDTTANALPLKAQHAAAVIAITEYCRGVILEACGPEMAEKTHIVRCGIDPEDFTLREAPIAPDNQTLVCVGRLCAAKQQVLLPEVAHRLAPEFPGLRIVLVGDGDDRAQIEARSAELGVSENIVLKGWGTKADVQRELSGARTMLLPSLAEGLPVVIMESLALGVPVISTRIAGIPELLDEGCGWIVPPGDIDALTAAVRACLETSPERLVEMGREGRLRVQERHDQARNAAELRRIIAALPKDPAAP